MPGQDVAGTVVAAGADVTRFQAGEEVFGIARGSFAEFAAAREGKLAHQPARLGFEQAAAVAVSGLAAPTSATNSSSDLTPPAWRAAPAKPST